MDNPRNDQTLPPRAERRSRAFGNELIFNFTAVILFLVCIYLILINHYILRPFKMIQPLADIKTYQ